MAAPIFRTQYTHTKAESDKTAITCLDKSLTQQQFKDESNINVLFGRYLETGEIPQVEGMAFGDFTGIYDFQTAMNAVRTAEESFQQLPARIKNRFDNNPQRLVEFLGDPENREEAEFLKIVKPRTDDTPPETPAMAPGSASATKSAPSAATSERAPGRGTKPANEEK